MYQSFPQSFYNGKNNAMPIPQQKIANASDMAFEKPCETNNNSGGILKIFDNISIDDIIIIGLVILLLTEGNDDWLLIGLLVFLFMQ